MWRCHGRTRRRSKWRRSNRWRTRWTIQSRMFGTWMIDMMKWACWRRRWNRGSTASGKGSFGFSAATAVINVHQHALYSKNHDKNNTCTFIFTYRAWPRYQRILRRSLRIILMIFRLVLIDIGRRDSIPASSNHPIHHIESNKPIIRGFDAPSGYSTHGLAFSWRTNLCRLIILRTWVY